MTFAVSRDAFRFDHTAGLSLRAKRGNPGVSVVIQSKLVTL